MRRGWAAALLLATACTTGGSAAPAAHRVVASPQPTSTAEVSVKLPPVTPVPTVAVTPAPVPAAAPQVAAPAAAPKPIFPKPVVPVVGLTAFKSLGSWIDVFDHTNDPATVVPLVNKMADKGAKTLYLETARYASGADIQYPKAVGAALDTAKARGMRVVAWYPPDFKDLERDVRRSLAAIKFRSPNGNRFDAFGADIEYTAGVPDHAKRNKLTVEYTKKLRHGAGATYPLAAIVIPPTWLERTPNRWPNFPWQTLSGSYNVFMPMNYWTALGKNKETAYGQTRKDAEKTRQLTGRPVHIIGGLGADADGPQTAAYVKAARDGGSIGGGLYDFNTTRSDVWDELQKLN